MKKTGSWCRRYYKKFPIIRASVTISMELYYWGITHTTKVSYYKMIIWVLSSMIASNIMYIKIIFLLIPQKPNWSSQSKIIDKNILILHILYTPLYSVMYVKIITLYLTVRKIKVFKNWMHDVVSDCYLDVVYQCPDIS